VRKPRVVLVHPPSKMFPYEVWPPAFDGLDVEILSVECRSREEALEAVREADVVMIGGFRVDAAMIGAMERARVICGFGHGFEGVDVDAATKAGILVTNAAEICHLEVANHAAALILALNRKVVQYDRAMRQGVWDRPAGRPITPLDGETAGLVGLGAIGQALARRLQPFGLRVIAYDPYTEEHPARELGVRMVGDLHSLLSESDWVSVQVPLNGETRHMLGEREFRAMKRTAYFVNCCRGGVVDEAALTRALQGGWIAGAGLDVFEHEPLAADHPLTSLGNVILTPHWLPSTRYAARLTMVSIATGIIRAAQGLVPANVVNPDVLQQPGFQAKLARFDICCIMVGSEHSIAVNSSPYATEALADRELDNVIKAKTDEYIAEQLGSTLAPQLIRYDAATIKRELIHQPIYHELGSFSVGPMHQSHALIEFGPDFRKKITDKWVDLTAYYRLMQTGLIAGGALLFLGTIFSYFRLDNATRGYYTGRLQFMTAAAILAIVGSGALLARWIYWL